MTSNEHRRNEILAGLSHTQWEEFQRHVTRVTFPAGHTLLRLGDPYSTAFFPVEGVVSGVGSLPGGQNVEVAAVGSDGLIGLGSVLAMRSAHVWFVVQLSATGYELPADAFARMFEEWDTLRKLTLAHAGRLLTEISRSATCNRFHSHRERLARWLLVTMRKAGGRELELTHEFIAQMVGGPRHAVTAALSELRATGAVDYRRGRIEILDAAKMLAAACECAATSQRAEP